MTAKEAQGWRGMCPCCANCSHNDNPNGIWDEKKSKRIRCELGAFPTSPLAWCPKHEWRKYQ